MKKQLTGLQAKIMKVLWDRGEASVVQVMDALTYEKDLARTTVATIIGRLEKYGYIARRRDGQTNIYYPLLSRADARQSMVFELVDSVFSGDRGQLVSHLLSDEEFSKEDIERVKEMILRHEEKAGRDDA